MDAEKVDYEKIAKDLQSELDMDDGSPYVKREHRVLTAALLTAHEARRREGLGLAIELAKSKKTTVLGNDEYELGRNDSLNELAIELTAIRALGEKPNGL